jgi:hypothetical protein
MTVEECFHGALRPLTEGFSRPRAAKAAPSRVHINLFGRMRANSPWRGWTVSPGGIEWSGRMAVIWHTKPGRPGQARLRGVWRWSVRMCHRFEGGLRRGGMRSLAGLAWDAITNEALALLDPDEPPRPAP